MLIRSSPYPAEQEKQLIAGISERGNNWKARLSDERAASTHSCGLRAADHTNILNQGVRDKQRGSGNCFQCEPNAERGIGQMKGARAILGKLQEAQLGQRCSAVALARSSQGTGCTAADGAHPEPCTPRAADGAPSCRRSAPPQRGVFRSCREEDLAFEGALEQMTDKVMNGRVPLPEKALSEGYARLRYRDTSLLIWQQQQQKLESAPPNTYLSRSRSMWYSQYGNEAILVRDKNKLDVSRDTGQSKFCAIM
ncbi:hypothetical protein Anapl_00614 [Anas platyrhynchos]|nr:hypothetical protein Anapl_00614 [Anas platyrhynchos]